MNEQNSNTELQIQPSKSFSLTPATLKEAMELSEMIAKSDICPKDFHGKAGNVLVAIQMGLELGLPPMQALQNIAVINGRPSVWGDALPALAQAHPHFEYINETFDDATKTAICKIKRKGTPEQTKQFSQEDAVVAGLWSKPGPWKNYPKRMLQMRARAFAIRDVFPDALKGVQVAEEVMDYPRDMGSAERVDTSTKKITEPELMPEYPEDRFNIKFPVWEAMIKSGKKPVGDVIATVQTLNKLTPDQLKKLMSVKVDQPQTEAADAEFISAYDNEEKNQ